MRRGRGKVEIDIDKLLGMKELVDRGQIQQKEACEFLKISPYLYRKYSKRYESINITNQINQ